MISSVGGVPYHGIIEESTLNSQLCMEPQSKFDELIAFS